jgi:hypothetical protein
LDLVVNFIKKYYESFSREGLRYAIEKMAPELRKTLLSYQIKSKEEKESMDDESESSHEQKRNTPKKVQKKNIDSIISENGLSNEKYSKHPINKKKRQKLSKINDDESGSESESSSDFSDSSDSDSDEKPKRKRQTTQTKINNVFKIKEDINSSMKKQKRA